MSAPDVSTPENILDNPEWQRMVRLSSYYEGLYSTDLVPRVNEALVWAGDEIAMLREDLESAVRGINAVEARERDYLSALCDLQGELRDVYEHGV